MLWSGICSDPPPAARGGRRDAAARGSEPTISRCRMSRFTVLVLLCACLVGTRAAPATAQAERAALGAAVGVAGGAVVTLSAVVFRARFQREYLDSVDDLIHWQTLPMIGAPAAGILFGLAGREAHIGSIVGSTGGMLAGAAVGSGIGWIVSHTPESPWAGGVIGAGVGLTVGGLYMGLRGWSRDEDARLDYPGFLRFGLIVPTR
jgi:hypothetical protein